MVKNLPCNAGDSGSIPGQGTQIPHVSEQLRLCTTTTEPMCTAGESVRPPREIRTIQPRSRGLQLRPDAAEEIRE